MSPEGMSVGAGTVLDRAEPPGAWPDGFVRGRPDRDALLVLSYLESLTPARLGELARREGSAAGCLRAVQAGRPGTDRDRGLAARLEPMGIQARLDRIGARMSAPGDQEYPADLLHLTDPPACLFVRGGSPAGLSPAVAMVGARGCTSYGREVARALAADLAVAGVVVVSGAARGVDAAAHLGALDESGRTAAVLGSGIDVAYPAGNRGLLDRIADRGVIVSEYPPGVPARPRRFPARNRIVAALSRGVVVVEGGEGSGSLITAEFAEDLGREVMAVPGPVTGPLSAAPNGLIRDGAHLVASAEDVLAVLNLRRVKGGKPARPPVPSSPAGLTGEENRVLGGLAGVPMTLDAAAAAADLEPGRVLRALAALEIRGLVVAEGGRYRRAPPRKARPAGRPGISRPD